MFQISEHYLPYAEDTMIVVAGGERVRILHASNRTVEELETFEASVVEEREHQDYADAHADDKEREARHGLYLLLREYLTKKNPSVLILCAPEAYQNEVMETLTKDQVAAITQFIPKNLASLPLDAIIRILQEKQAQ